MNANARTLAILSIGFLFVAPGAAQPETPLGDLGSFTAQSVGLDGEGRATGEFSAFQLGITREEWPLPEPADLFELRAERLNIEIIHDNFYASTPAATTPSQVTSTFHSHGRSHIRFEAPRGAFEFVALPLPNAEPPQLSADLRHGFLSASRVDHVEIRDEAKDRPLDGFSRATSQDVGLRWNRGGSDVHVQGSFRFSAWYWNFTVEDLDEGSLVSYYTGERSTAATPGVGVLAGIRADVERRQALVTVTNGTLDFLRPSVNGGLLLGRDVQAWGDGSWTLQDAAGLLADGRNLRATTATQLRLEGDLTVSVDAAEGDKVNTAWSGSPDRVQADDDAVAWAAPLAPALAANTLGLPWWGWAGALVVTAAVGFLGRTWHVRRERSRMRTLELLSRIRDDERAVKVADSLLKSPSFRFDAAILKTEALVRQGRLEEAGRFVKQECDWMDPASGVREFLQALVAAHEGDRENAALFLGRALATAPEYRTEVLRTPIFQLVSTDPRVARFLRGGNAAAPIPDGYS